MKESDDRLWDVYQAAGRSLPICDADLAFAERCLSAANTEDVGIACEILLRASNSEAQRKKAVASLEALCVGYLEGDLAVSLLNALLYVSLDEFSDQRGVTAFIKSCAYNRIWAVRTNVVDSLRSLAGGGDRQAVDLIEVLATDQHDAVRDNAKLALKWLKQ